MLARSNDRYALPDLAPYRAVSCLGEGGTGRVYLAETALGERVAVKLFHPEILRRPRARAKLLFAAEAARRIHHANVAQVIACGVLDGDRPFVAMEAVIGESLATSLAARTALPAGEAITLALELCDGLAAAHQAGCLHLDLKPTNVLLAAGEPPIAKLIDFGAGRTPAPGQPTGTPEYWSPEQALGQPVDARSDLYSLGVVLYEALSGQVPFRSHTYSDVVAKHVHSPPAPLRAPAGWPPIPAALEAVVTRCLAKQPCDRYASAGEVGAALGQVRAQTEGQIIMNQSLPSPPTVDAMRSACPSCGTPSTSGAIYCASCGSTLEPDSLTLPETDVRRLGTMVGPYRLLELLGRGGMGSVFLAEHTRLGRRVAIKMLHRELADNPQAVKRFFSEARAVNRINHENIIAITDFIEEPGGDNYIVMELLRGTDLLQLMPKEGVLPLSRTLTITTQMASALGAVHAAGIVHRDLKPENLFVIERADGSDFVKVLDFGIAKLRDLGDGMPMQQTAAGFVMGTPEYMAPEQATGKNIDHRTDIYAFGLILYELLAGQKPFRATNLGELIVKRLTEVPPKPARLLDASSTVKRSLDDLVLRCLDKDAEKRPQSMREVEDALRAVTVVQTAEMESLAVPPRRRLGRVWAIAGVAGLLLAMGLFAALKSGAAPAGTAKLAAASPAVSPTVELAFDSTPQGAQVYRVGDLRPLGTTPFAHAFDKSTAEVTFEFRLGGHEVDLQKVSLAESARVGATLVARRAAAAEAVPATVAPPAPVKEAAPQADAEKPTEKTKRHVGGGARRPSALDRGAVLNPF